MAFQPWPFSAQGDQLLPPIAQAASKLCCSHGHEEQQPDEDHEVRHHEAHESHEAECHEAEGHEDHEAEGHEGHEDHQACHQEPDCHEEQDHGP